MQNTKTRAQFRKRDPKARLTVSLRSVLGPSEIDVVVQAHQQAQYKNARHKLFQDLYETCSQFPLSALLATRTQVLADWDEVGYDESSLQLAVLECRIDKVRSITIKCGCPDPVPGHVRLDRRAA